MKPPPPDSDATVRIVPARPPRSRAGARVAVRLAIGLGVVVLAVAIGWFVWPEAPNIPPVTTPAVAPVAELPIETATVDQIRVHEPGDLSVIRLAENPRIVVLDFASLTRQRNMLDRVAALIEKAGLPRDRILNAAELNSAVRSGGDADAGLYYGHDYSAASFVRFFDIADRAHVALTPEEQILRHLLERLGWMQPGTLAGLISVPRVGANVNVTAAARDTILTHELSHGEYFSNPVYAAYVHQFCMTALTPSEQAAFRAFLEEEGYDTGNPELVENETQAYLLFTPDPRFFALAQVHMTPERRADLRATFLRDMAPGWLKDVLAGVP